eukprot:CAMPEP_0175125340 /NCGR_PEP_ID=MMETSP0087-20121206/3264_1 /TAXON_ID=136419 /ORGANISM="Unknown Unknown, Strain D1" /LENGTH=395 /DNA_ID=CAMNT_0016407171 /DNA_START=32 /DNA_END=1219 /DNA_ORIENTATION=-
MSVSLRGMFNVNMERLESVLDNILCNMEKQSARMAVLEAECNNRVSLKTHQALETRVSEFIDHVTCRLESLEKRFDLARPILNMVGQNTQHLAVCSDALKTKLDATDYLEDKAQNNLALEQLMDHRQDNLLKQDLKESPLFANLQEAQHRLVASMSAAEAMLANKIDRAELPLLSATTASVADLIAFKDSATGQLGAAEDRLAALDTCVERLQQEKESKEAVVQRMQNIHHILTKKCDVKWASSTFGEPLEALSQRLNSHLQHVNQQAFDQLRGMVHDNVTNKLAASADLLATHTSALEQLSHEHQQISQQLRAKLDLPTANAKFQQLLDTVRTEILTFQKTNMDDIKVQSAFLSDAREQISAVKRYQTEVDKKLAVTIRFIDWFSDVRLKGGGI